MGRFNTIDRYADKYTSLSTYQYGANNPIVNIDVNGDSTWTTTRTVTNGSNIINYYTTHITGKVLKNSTSYGTAGDFASKLNSKLNSQSGSYSSDNEDGGTTTNIYNVDANYQGANSIADVSASDHLLVLVDKVTGSADENLGGGPAVGRADINGNVAYVEAGSNDPVNTAFHEVGHNLGLVHPTKNSMNDPMSYSGRGTNFSNDQNFTVYRNAKSGFSNNGYNRARITNSTTSSNNISTPERPYRGIRIK